MLSTALTINWPSHLTTPSAHSGTVAVFHPEYIRGRKSFFFVPIITLALLSASLLAVTQIPDGITGPPFPPTTTVRAIILLSREELSISSLVDSRRIVRTHAARLSQQWIVLANFHKI